MDEKSTVKSRFGSVIDLEEKREAELRRKSIASSLQKIVKDNLAEIRRFFVTADPDRTGYVPQHKFRALLELLKIPIEVARFSMPGYWHEEREVSEVYGTDGHRSGPFKEHLMWVQNKMGAQANYENKDIGNGHVKYEEWLKNTLTPEHEVSVETAVSNLSKDAGELYELWRLVNANKQALLADLWDYDKEKIGYVKTDDFHQCLQLALGITKQQASLLVSSIPLQGDCGSIAYRRWIAEFSRSPRVGWQSYLNVTLLASGSREVDMQHADKAVTLKAKIETERRVELQSRERQLATDHEMWRHEQARMVHQQMHPPQMLAYGHGHPPRY